MTEATKATVYRVLQMITRLKSGHFRKSTLAKQLGVHEKTIGRYIALLTDIGYSVEEDDRNRLFFAEPDADQIAHHFEPLEIELLRQLLVTLPLKDCCSPIFGLFNRFFKKSSKKKCVLNN
jgi:predicted DNA-binding transcriptional regulator YafY